MSHTYKLINWNRQKKIYDWTFVSIALVYLAVFLGLGAWWHPNATAETLLIRGLGTLGLLMLHVILAIGPLCRLNTRFLPLLYNRRHLGVAMFLVALSHGVFSLVQFHALGDVNPLVSLFISNTRYASVSQFPFQQLGFYALGILFLMAASSHDYWQHRMTPGVWKRLHMAVYVAYGLLVAHVSLGALQSETSPWLTLMLGAGMASLIGLHLAAALHEWRKDRMKMRQATDGFADACDFASIREGRACVVTLGSERIAIFKHEGEARALSNVCRHQNGPLGEGKIVSGCVTCPWHGYQYLPDTGISPPPFDDRVEVFATKVVDGRVWVKL